MGVRGAAFAHSGARPPAMTAHTPPLALSAPLAGQFLYNGVFRNSGRPAAALQATGDAMPQLRSKRVYLPPEAEDGCRVLVDRLWPRGLSRAKAQLDQWQKDLAPSSALRTWFGHRAERFDEFALAYRNELEHNPLASDFAGACRDSFPHCQLMKIISANKLTAFLILMRLSL